jgi:hypothetical protein
MDNKYRTGGKHGARSNTTIYGAFDQSPCSSSVIECQNSQIQRTDSRSEGNSFSPNGPTHFPVCQHMRGSLRQVVRV